MYCLKCFLRKIAFSKSIFYYAFALFIIGDERRAFIFLLQIKLNITKYFCSEKLLIYIPFQINFSCKLCRVYENNIWIFNFYLSLNFLGNIPDYKSVLLISCIKLKGLFDNIYNILIYFRITINLYYYTTKNTYMDKIHRNIKHIR